LARQAGPWSLVIFFALACSGGGSDEGSPTGSGQATICPTAAQEAQGNLLINPGFEGGSEPWITLAPESGFEVTQDQAYSGTSSARLRMRDVIEAEGAKVYYLVQEINPATFPEVIRGFYRVENWNKGTVRQYLQFVVIAIGPKNLPADSPNYQLRYPLAGIDSPPFDIGNAFFVFLSREEPKEGEWVPFEANIKEDFQRLWKAVPCGYEKLRLLFEVRWDGKVAGDGAPEGDVYYDDLYTGATE